MNTPRPPHPAANTPLKVGVFNIGVNLNYVLHVSWLFRKFLKIPPKKKYGSPNQGIILISP
jgi:hypothetical protein